MLLFSCRALLSFTMSWSLLKFMFIALVILSDHLVLCLPFFLLPSIFPSIRVFFSASGGQSIGASALVFPMSIQNWFSLGLTGLISSLSPEPSRKSSPTPQFESTSFSVLSLLYGPTLTNGLGLFKIMFLSIKWGPILYFETYLEIVVNIEH